MSVKQLISKILGVPNQIYNKAVLVYRHVQYGRNLKINGRIYCVSNTKGGIQIGDNVRINSSMGSNPIGGDSKTILFAKGNGKIKIGNGCGISNSTFFACESITLGENILIGGGTHIYDSDFHWTDYERRIREPGGAAEPVVIKDGAFIGAGCTILKGVTVGEKAVVAAGSVVTRDIPDGEIWGGNPVRYLKDVEMRDILKPIKQSIHRGKNKDACVFEENVVIDSADKFEGRNRLTVGVTFLNSSLGYASYVGARSFFQNTKIGRFTCIATDVSTMAGDHPTSRFASIHPAFYSTRGQSGFSYVDREKYSDFKWLDEDRTYTIEIGNDVWIGSGVKITEGVRIGDGAVIAAGAIVTKDVEPYAIVGGVPAKVLKYRFDKETIQKLLELRWWDKDLKWIEEHADEFEDVDRLLNMPDSPDIEGGGV